MAIAETARLLATLELQDKFSGTIRTVEGKLDRVTTKLDTIGSTAKTKFGKLRDAARDTNTQTSAVNLALVGIERFVPPSIRPLVEGLETLNNQSPKGLLALVATGIKSGKDITVNLVEKFAESGGLPGIITALGGASALAAAALPAAALIVTGLLANAFNNNPTRTKAGIKGTFEPIASPFDLPKVINNFGTAIELLQKEIEVLNNPPSEKSGGLSLEDRDILYDQVTATNNVADKVEGLRLQKPPVVNAPITLNVKTNVFGSTATTTVTYNRYVPSIAGLLP